MVSETYYGLPSTVPSAVAAERIRYQAQVMFPNTSFPIYGGGCVVMPQPEPVAPSPVCMSCDNEAVEWMEQEAPRWYEKSEEERRLRDLEQLAEEERERLYRSKISTRIKHIFQNVPFDAGVGGFFVYLIMFTLLGVTVLPLVAIGLAIVIPVALVLTCLLLTHNLLRNLYRILFSSLTEVSQNRLK